MPKHIQERADFGIVRYANCWEDADVLCAALKPAEGKRFLSIASAGDNSFSLLAGGATVVAADLSQAQLACVELRREAFKSLTYDELLEFLGVTDSTRRAAVFGELKVNLSENARSFWEHSPEAIKNGFIHAGKFENYFRKFRTRIIPLIHSRKKIRQLLDPKSLDQQSEFYDRHWNTIRWRMLFRFFFSRFVMGRLGRDPEFFRYVEGSVSERILSRTRHALTKIPTHSNPYLRYILSGNYLAPENGTDQPGALPHYLRRENFESIRSGLDRLTLFHGSIQAAAERHRESGFDGYNLSDIFEYLDPKLCETIYRRLIDVARPGARWAYWNMLVPRQVPEPLAESINRLDEFADKLLERDKAWFYSAFMVEEKP